MARASEVEARNAGTRGLSPSVSTGQRVNFESITQEVKFLLEEITYLFICGGKEDLSLKL